MFQPVAADSGQLTAIATHVNFIASLSCASPRLPAYRAKVFAIRNFLLGHSQPQLSFAQLSSSNQDLKYILDSGKYAKEDPQTMVGVDWEGGEYNRQIHYLWHQGSCFSSRR